MTREGHARFWERPGVKVLRATRQKHACRLPGEDGECNFVTGRICCGAENFRVVPKDEIATAIARCAGRPTDSIATGASVDLREGGAIRYGGSSQIFFHRSACARLRQPVSKITSLHVV